MDAMEVAKLQPYWKSSVHQGEEASEEATRHISKELGGDGDKMCAGFCIFLLSFSFVFLVNILG